MSDWSATLLALLSVAFGCWAGLVAWIGAGIRSDLRGIAGDLKTESHRLNKYIVQTESRLAVLEEKGKEPSGH